MAYRLGHLFTQIETDEQRVLHNHVLAEVMDIINKSYPQGEMLMQEEKALFDLIAEWLLYPKTSRMRKRFLFRMAEKVMSLGQQKG